jgi:hypothetical protein
LTPEPVGDEEHGLHVDLRCGGFRPRHRHQHRGPDGDREDRRNRRRPEAEGDPHLQGDSLFHQEHDILCRRSGANIIKLLSP